MPSVRESPRILYCSDTYPPQVNGVSVVTAVSVAGMQERGWECAVVAPKYPKPYGKAFASDAPGLAAVRMHVRLPSTAFPPYPDIRLVSPLYARVARAVRDFRPHLIHCQTEFLVGRLGQVAGARQGIPLVSSYHTDFSRYTEAYRIGWLRGWVTSYIKRFHNRSKRVYTPSEPARADLARMGVPAEHIEVWGRSVDVKQFHPNMWSGALREQIGVDDEFVFLHVGRLAPEKNVELLLDAYQLFRRRNPDFRSVLVVAGDGPAAPQLRARAGEGQGVTFLGNMDRRIVLPLLYASSDVFLYSSETETLGLVILEAMASGIPVVATPAGGVAENLRDGENGLAFPAGDAPAMAAAMERIAKDQALRHQLAKGAREWAESKSWSAELDRLDASYKEVVELGSSPHASFVMRQHA
ncbi:MAG TPA: glycosyltransferase family 1 protein [Gemmatimonadaceae bacterium]|nr:glycosyltransferase family 1 protein [Gemmatimonadaceae bacterium]